MFHCFYFCHPFLPFGHTLQSSTSIGSRSSSAQGIRTSLQTLHDLHLLPKGVESSVDVDTTTQEKGFYDITQEFAKKASCPVPRTWGQRTCAGFHLWNLGFNEISMQVCSKVGLAVSDHGKEVENLSWSWKSCFSHVSFDQTFLRKISFVDHFK